MTKLRHPGSIKYAVAHCIGVLGNAVESLTGKSERLVRMYSDPDEEGRHIPMKDALALDAAMREAGHGQPIFEAYAALLDDVPSGRAGGCPMRAFLDVAEKVGPLAATVSSAVADGRIDAAERRAIIGAAHDLIGEARALLDTISPVPTVVKHVPPA